MIGRPLVPGDRFTPWRRRLPAEWRLEPLKYHLVINGETLRESTPSDFEIRYIDIGSVDSFGRVSEPELLSFGTAPSRARRVLRDGDTIISTVRTYLRAIAHIADATENLVCSTGFAVLSPPEYFDPRFIGYWMRSNHIVDEIMARSTGVSYPAIAPSEIGSFPIPLIDRALQASLADYLDEALAPIDALIFGAPRANGVDRKGGQGLLSTQIASLQEYRETLITSVVTGHPEVPGGIRPAVTV